jgi:Right handed beta helix region
VSRFECRVEILSVATLKKVIGFGVISLLHTLPAISMSAVSHSVDALSQSLLEGRLGNTIIIPSIDCIGRVVMLKDVESKPELNGKYGLIKEYKEDKDRYLIQLLDTTSSATSSTCVLMKYEKIIVLAPKIYLHNSTYNYHFNSDEFLIIYPKFCGKLGLGVVHIPAGISTPTPVDRELYIFTSCLLKGVLTTTLCEKGFHMPSSCISAQLRIHTTELIEIENIFFLQPALPSKCIWISKGRVVFRWCRFKGNDYGILANYNNDGDKMEITFENCVFESSTCGVCIGGGAKAIFLNCHFINNSYVGIRCQTTAQADVIVSTFSSNKMGIDIFDKAVVCKLSHCSIKDSRGQGILITKGAKVILNNCHIHKSGRAAVEVEGGSLDACDCAFEESECGIIVLGKYCDIKADTCTIARNKGIGLSVHINCVGELIFNNCRIHSNGINIDNSGLSKSRLVFDGTIFPTNGLLAKDFTSVSPKCLKSFELQCADNAAILRNRRSLKSAGLLDSAPTCGYCLKLESPGKHFDKCSICMGTAYCTKQCQVLTILHLL